MCFKKEQENLGFEHGKFEVHSRIKSKQLNIYVFS